MVENYLYGNYHNTIGSKKQEIAYFPSFSYWKQIPTIVFDKMHALTKTCLRQ